MALELFDFFKSSKKQEPVKKVCETKEHPNLFNVSGDDISDVKPSTAVLNVNSILARKTPIRRR
jgi:hypothetical protein